MDSGIENLKPFDPFADLDSDASTNASQNYIHIRIQQRNGRKTLTTIQGLPKELNFKKLATSLKRKLCCNGTVIEDVDLGKVIQLQGDQRTNVSDFLLKEKICAKKTIKIHGF